MSLPTQITTLGFRTVSAFQAAWNLGPRLQVDGIPGPLTLAAARLSLQRHVAGQPDLSAHFAASEFACHCGGLPGCQHVLVRRELLQSLEALRTVTGPLSIVSGYRCPRHNVAVGGASDSQHLYGAAADIPPGLPHGRVAGMHLFSGIGWTASDGLVVHVDRRDVVAGHSGGATVLHPATWTYPR